MFRGGPSGALFRIAARGTTIGRAGDPAMAGVLLEDARTSRQHARLAFDGTGWSITDLWSRNGGFVDGVVLPPGQAAPLAHGSVIRLGDTLAVFVTDHVDQDDFDEPGFFPGVSAAARRIRRRVDVLARATGHVLVLGETGTGKERVARQIGARAPAFVPVNCARSELFGHVRGAFTGATAARDGLITIAGGGVLFLDEVDELPLEVQGELLRFLEDGSYRPPGSSELRTSRARVVAATNVDLDEAARDGRFRRDLLDCLRASSPPLSLPPLRERREDLPGWTDRFVREAVADVPANYCDAGALESLLLVPWPENLRELRSALRGAVEGPRIWPLSSSRLPARVHHHRRALRKPAAVAPVEADDRPATPDDESTEPASREQIVAALVATGGGMIAAAKHLRINRRSLYRLCEKLGIDLEPFRQGD
ncbi:MAG: sigma 54-interacting transcriptional regulator [Rhodoglobus sp.]